MNSLRWLGASLLKEDARMLGTLPLFGELYHASGLPKVSQVLEDSHKDTNNSEAKRNEIPILNFS